MPNTIQTRPDADQENSTKVTIVDTQHLQNKDGSESLVSHVQSTYNAEPQIRVVAAVVKHNLRKPVQRPGRTPQSSKPQYEGGYGNSLNLEPGALCAHEISDVVEEVSLPSDLQGVKRFKKVKKHQEKAQPNKYIIIPTEALTPSQLSACEYVHRNSELVLEQPSESRKEKRARQKAEAMEQAKKAEVEAAPGKKVEEPKAAPAPAPELESSVELNQENEHLVISVAEVCEPAPLETVSQKVRHSDKKDIAEVCGFAAVPLDLLTQDQRNTYYKEENIVRAGLAEVNLDKSYDVVFADLSAARLGDSDSVRGMEEGRRHSDEGSYSERETAYMLENEEIAESKKDPIVLAEAEPELEGAYDSHNPLSSSRIAGSVAEEISEPETVDLNTTNACKAAKPTVILIPGNVVVSKTPKGRVDLARLSEQQRRAQESKKLGEPAQRFTAAKFVDTATTRSDDCKKLTRGLSM